jgi:hypothetical protein
MSVNFKQNCFFKGPPGPSTLYAKNMCFQPPFQTQLSNLNCTPNYSYYGGTLFDVELNYPISSNASNSLDSFNSLTYSSPYSNSFQSSSQSLQSLQSLQSHNLYENGNPKLIGVTNNNSIITQHKGIKSVVTPINLNNSTRRNCKQGIQSLFQCSQLEGKDLNKCNRKKKCFQYNIIKPDGSLIDMGVVKTPYCKKVAKKAFKKMKSQCSDCFPCDSTIQNTKPFFQYKV